jgi:uncharacterized protein (TIGR02145 family)
MKKSIRLLVALAFSTLTSFAQVGIGTTSPNSNAALELESSSQGMLFPRMTTTQRNVINAPAEGLTIFNTTDDCLQTYTGTWDCVTAPATIPNNATCASATISATPCTAGELASGINGGSLGNKYDNNNGGTYSVVEIGGQCWMQESIDVNPTESPTWVNATDTGWYGYYNATYQEPGEGTLLQWSAAMDGATTERAQGVCPTDWHIPSDCEWMYLENSLGMTTYDQELTGFRNSGSVGSKLKSSLVGGTNSSGFTALLAGYRLADGTVDYRGTFGSWWSSSETSATNAPSRSLYSSQAVVGRYSSVKSNGLSVRCLKD